MTLRVPQKHSFPVLDSPSKPAGQKVFLTRRPVSLAGKPVLAEKHLPVQPSYSILSRKCFSASAENLFRHARIQDLKVRYKPDFCFASEKIQQFENRASITFGMPRPFMARQTFSHACNILPEICQQASSLFFPAQKISTAQFSVAENRLHRLLSKKCEFSFLQFPFVMASNSTIKTRQILQHENQPSGRRELSEAIFSNFAFKFRRRRFVTESPLLKSCNNYLPARLTFSSNASIRKHFSAGFYSRSLPENPVKCTGRFCITQKLFILCGNLKLSAESFSPERERHTVFVLESKAVFPPTCTEKAIEIRSQTLMSLQHRLENVQSYTISSLCLEKKAELLKPQLAACARITAKHGKTLPVISPSCQLTDEAKSTEQNGDFSASEKDNRFRLRLKLRRMAFSHPPAAMQTQQLPAVTAIEKGTKKTLAVSFPDIKIANIPCAAFAHSVNSAKVRIQHDFRKKRFTFLINAASHARYTLKSLKNIVISRSPARIALIQISMAFLNPLKKKAKHFSFSSLRKISATQFANDVFYEKSRSFTLIGLRQEFSRILDQPVPKRLKLSTMRYFSNQKSEQLLRRRKYLRTLRFKLQSINDGFLFSRDKPVRRLANSRDAGEISQNQQKVTLEIASGKVNERMREKPLRASTRLRLKRYPFKQILPGQALAEMVLKLPMVGIKTGTAMPQKHFVLPPLHEKKQREFNCRLRLLPHPFGFPEFRFTDGKLFCLHHRQTFVPPMLTPPEARIAGQFILKREQVFLPPLSMKNPRRMLYASANPAHQANEYYKPMLISDPENMQSPPPITNFNHPWQNASAIVRLKPVSTEIFYHEKRQKQAHLPSCQLKLSAPRFLVKPGLPAGFLMPTISRLLLRARRFAIQAEHAETVLTAKNSDQRYRPTQQPLMLSAPCFKKHVTAFSLLNPAIETFLQRFNKPDDVSSSFIPAYHARFRSLRFPWRPEASCARAQFENFGLLDLSEPAASLDLPDDMRASSFTYELPANRVLPVDKNAKAGFKFATGPGATFGAWFRRQSKDAFSAYYPPGNIKIEQPEQSLQHFINPESFFVCREKSQTRLKKALRTYVFKLSSRNMLLSTRSEFSEFGLKSSPANSILMDSVHWIIMMHSFVRLSYQHFVLFDKWEKFSPELAEKLEIAEATYSRRLAFLSKTDQKQIPRFNYEKKQKFDFENADRHASFSSLPFKHWIKENAMPSAPCYRFNLKKENVMFSCRQLPDIFAAMRSDRFCGREKIVFKASLAPSTQICALTSDLSRVAPFEKSFPGTGIAKRKGDFKFAFVPDWVDTTWKRPQLK